MATQPASRRRRILLRASLVVAATLVTLVIAELLCRAIFGTRGARWDVAAGLRRDQPEPDAVLGTRMAPNAPGHDARGFRNEAAPAQADLVAIGDSHTWGTNARIDEAWPQVLGRSLGRTAYNLALGGYGPIQYEALAEEALTLRPSVIIVALYVGNDLWDAYVRVWSEDRYRDRRKTGGGDASRTIPSARPSPPSRAGGAATNVPRPSRGFNATSRSSGSPHRPASSRTAATKSRSPATARGSRRARRTGSTSRPRARARVSPLPTDSSPST